ncbi:hypothetical protein E1A91_D03G152700v1 [Gossypium mustelinum]|uniref:Uncharacterized protein n=1 Tax=Gossypium mustelinum TaxID=34275 RepID=A0A5D2VNS1_GOSMU|nr:hypothetical protein E1A91_D03G152700v1 [Gossypium mustelinum]
MNVSHASVHPVEDPPTTNGTGGGNNNEVPGVRMKDVQGMPGTLDHINSHICCSLCFCRHYRSHRQQS